MTAIESETTFSALSHPIGPLLDTILHPTARRVGGLIAALPLSAAHHQVQVGRRGLLKPRQRLARRTPRRRNHQRQDQPFRRVPNRGAGHGARLLGRRGQQDADAARGQGRLLHLGPRSQQMGHVRAAGGHGEEVSIAC